MCASCVCLLLQIYDNNVNHVAAKRAFEVICLEHYPCLSSWLGSLMRKYCSICSNLQNANFAVVTFGGYSVSPIGYRLQG